ncbi:Uncharacterised protein [Vibrio cholerae]|nr:Uncharacterised protein [Vibrio cholerae]CSC48843.1 Uncharacterised protein [Vibrio cholerae]CSC88796.1 Uncharacterised protein [Vibrio cholerae]CSH92003.1 Uncharacterised protein [Vibrio cholerae]
MRSLLLSKLRHHLVALCAITASEQIFHQLITQLIRAQSIQSKRLIVFQHGQRRLKAHFQAAFEEILHRQTPKTLQLDQIQLHRPTHFEQIITEWREKIGATLPLAARGR